VAGGQERILRRRIKSIQSTKKITRAMELIAATRVGKAQVRAAEARPYSEQLTSVILDLARLSSGLSHPLLREPGSTTTDADGEPKPAGKAGFVVVTSDRGLCGAYNSSVIRAAEREISDRRGEGKDYSLYLVGKKALSYFRFRNYDITETTLGVTDQPTYEDARAIAVPVREAFESGELDTVDLVYTRFISVGTQEVVVRRFLPLQTAEADPAAEDPASEGHGALAQYEFEPSPEGILDELLPRYVEARVFAALLDASASEHAARQRAMKAATDNAEDLIIRLSRIMNRARQDSITTEIMEIAGGAEALSQSTSHDDTEAALEAASAQ
jgi:F-type H+-transporting ATPase subunit gamma